MVKPATVIKRKQLQFLEVNVVAVPEEEEVHQVDSGMSFWNQFMDPSPVTQQEATFFLVL